MEVAAAGAMLKAAPSAAAMWKAASVVPLGVAATPGFADPSSFLASGAAPVAGHDMFVTDVADITPPHLPPEVAKFVDPEVARLLDQANHMHGNKADELVDYAQQLVFGLREQLVGTPDGHEVVADMAASAQVMASASPTSNAVTAEMAAASACGVLAVLTAAQIARFQQGQQNQDEAIERQQQQLASDVDRSPHVLGKEHSVEATDSIAGFGWLMKQAANITEYLQEKVDCEFCRKQGH